MNWPAVSKTFRSPVVILLGLSLLCRVISLFFIQRTWSYSSDNVSWQTILFTWTPLNGHIAFLGLHDNFITNVPFFILFGHFLAAGRTELFIEAAVFVVINFVLFYIAGLYFLRKCNVTITYSSLLSFLWVAVLSGSFGQLFLNTNWRDYEAGISFVYLMLAAKIYYGEFRPSRTMASKLLAFLAVVVAGLFTYSDPYFFYFTTLPITILFVVLGYKSISGRRQALMIALSGSLSLLIAQVTNYLTYAIGIRTPAGPALGLVGPRTAAHNIILAAHSIVTIFGVGFFDDHTSFLGNVSNMLNLTVLIFIIYLLYDVWRSRRNRLRPLELWSRFLCLLLLWVLTAYIVSSAVVDAQSYRYFLMLVFASTLLISLRVSRLGRVRPVFYGLLMSATVFKLLSGYSGTVPGKTAITQPNAVNYTIIAQVERLGLKKGYGNYWDGDINTYLSRDRVNFLPTSCVDGRTSPLSLLVDSTEFAEPSTNSFILIDPDAGGSATCPERRIMDQFGLPSKIVHVSDKSILVYKYDVIRKMVSS